MCTSVSMDAQAPGSHVWGWTQVAADLIHFPVPLSLSALIVRLCLCFHVGT